MNLRKRHEKFPACSELLDLVDEDSQEKVKRALQGKEEVQIEVNMRTFSNRLLFLIFHFKPEAYHSLRCFLCYSPIHEHMTSVSINSSTVSLYAYARLITGEPRFFSQKQM